MGAPETHAEEIAAVLRGAAARAAELSGGRALVFAGRAQDSMTPPLRAAAGFGSPDEARAAAEAIGPSVVDAALSGEATSNAAPASLGGVVTALPMAVAPRIHGVIAVLADSEPADTVGENLASICRSAAIRMDHAALLGRVEALEQELANGGASADQQSDEILKLSEALFAQDIELLRNNEKLGKVEKLKHDFIEKMSRELRTPLNSIIESIITVLAGENESLSDSAKGSLRSALDDGTSFLRSLQNILDLWRIKQGELPVEVQEVNFREVVEESIFSVQDTLGDKPVEIRKQIQEPLPKVRTDLAKVNQILFLLLDNAVKFTTAGTIDIRVRMAGEHLICEIEDTGIGICPDDQQFIFDEFHQVDGLSSTKYRGSGLGLTLVRDLLGLLDGEIELTSEVGQGTRVAFHLPVQVI